MDIKAPMESALEGNPFADAIADPLCKLNLKETSEFVKAFPATATTSSQRQRRPMEAPPTPGRPVLSFSGGNPSRKSVPSKWHDAEKWVISGSCHESPALVTKVSDASKISRPNGVLYKKGDAFAENLRVDQEKVISFDTALHCLATPEVVPQDKFTDNVEPPCPNFRFSGPTNESSLFRGSYCASMKTATSEEIPWPQHRDIGTEMTPVGSVATTRCHTPIESSSPARHNSPYESGPLKASNTATLDISELKDCHFAKLQLSAQYDSMVSNWSSREEEEADVSKSLRHTEMGGGRRSFAETRACLWEGEERTKICLRYQREEAKIQAWINLQNAKTEAQSRKLEVKIQKMRSNLEEKMMKRMAFVQRRAEEWRAAAQLQHSQQILRSSEQAQQMRSLHASPVSCGCFPCSNHL